MRRSLPNFTALLGLASMLLSTHSILHSHSTLPKVHNSPFICCNQLPCSAQAGWDKTGCQLLCYWKATTDTMHTLARKLLQPGCSKATMVRWEIFSRRPYSIKLSTAVLKQVVFWAHQPFNLFDIWRGTQCSMLAGLINNFESTCKPFRPGDSFILLGTRSADRTFWSLFCYCNVPEIEMTNCIDSTCLLTKLLTTSCIPLFPFSVPILKWDHWGNCKKGQCECSAGIVHIKHVKQLLSIAHETQF